MPELPEVETVCRGLNQMTLGQRIVGGEVYLPRTVAHPTAAAVVAGLRGGQFVGWQRRGKYLLGTVATETGTALGWLGVHLRMTGQMLWMPSAEPISPHCRVRLQLEGDRDLRFIDQRTFGRWWWIVPPETPAQIMTGMAALGPEPFDSAFSAPYLQQTCGDRLRPIKNALLDQTLVAGVGNIYADEALFLSGIHPLTPCRHLSLAAWERLRGRILQVLTEGIEAGGTTFSDFRNVQGINGNYGGSTRVYDRDGQPCQVCGTVIERLKLAGRSAHFCPRCQPQGADKLAG